MWRKSYSRPIPPAITELRPARETCEHCHWPKKFFGAQLRELVHCASDENNTRRDVSMLLKTGGGDESTGRPEGIHLHMALDCTVDYIATDDKLQNVPWVRMINENGEELIYRSDGRPSSDPRPEGKLRRLDCMDCHNRPAHRFRSPREAVDVDLKNGRIDTTLPFIKREAVAALTVPYPDVETAEARIGARLRGFYQTEYPDVWDRRMASVNLAIDRVRDIYRHNFFPEMNVDWRTYPDNIGHVISRGCFRCHEGKHINQHGDTISHECDACHVFLNPVVRNGTDAVVERGQFRHPYPLEGSHATLRCDQCHNGGGGPVPTCSGCHTLQARFRAGALEAFEPFGISAEPMAEAVDCEACHDVSQAASVETIDSACMDCHEDEEERFDGMLASWSKEVDELLRQAEARADARGRRLLQTLRKAGPLHNMDGTRAILQSLPAASEPSGDP